METYDHAQTTNAKTSAKQAPIPHRNKKRATPARIFNGLERIDSNPMECNELLFPSLIVCTCQVRFQSKWFEDGRSTTGVTTSQARITAGDSALSLFLRHFVARADRPFKHCAKTIMLRCIFCSKSINVDDYRSHLAVKQTSQGKIMKCNEGTATDHKLALRLYAEAARRAADDGQLLPMFQCALCIQRGKPDVKHSVRSLIGHTHGNGRANVKARVAPSFRLCLPCRICKTQTSLDDDDLFRHASLMHRRSQLKPSNDDAIVRLYVTAPDEMRSVQDDAIDECDSAESDPESAVPTVSAQQCPTCRMHFRNAADLREHESVKHQMQVSYRCRSCSARFFNKSRRDAHFIKHNDERAWVECDVCGRAFTNRWDLTKHKLTHLPCCKECGARYDTDAELDRHRRFIHKPPMFVCERCDVGAFFEKRQLRRHYFIAHVWPSEDSVRGDREFEQVDDDYRAQSSNEGEQDGRHSATQRNADESTIADDEYKRRRKIQAVEVGRTPRRGKQPLEHQCDECGECLADAAALAAHRSTHDGLYRCAECDETFLSRRAWCAHSQRHAGKA